MRILVNALSAAGSLSGMHVLFGHLEQLSMGTAGQHEYLVLHRRRMKPIGRPFADNVSWVAASNATAHWSTRLAWEATVLPRLLKRWNVDLLLTPTGTTLPCCPVPQVSLAQNPWCMVEGIQRTASQRLKSAIQRQAYRRAMRRAAVMIYNSHHMQSLYRQNAPGCEESASVVAYQGIDDETFQAAASATAKKVPLRILSVSVMASWKGVETLVQALAKLRKNGVDAELRVVGPWADSQYEQLVRHKIQEHGLEQAVTVTGKVSRAQLHQEYAEAQVFCLMSRCESFGIPAVEAQAFGTPVVGSSTCAMAEVCRDGGEFCHPNDSESTAELVGSLLTDAAHWRQMSEAAKENASRFRWEQCSKPLVDLFQNWETNSDRQNSTSKCASIPEPVLEGPNVSVKDPATRNP